MTILTSITIITCIIIIGIFNIISGYFKPEVILDKRRKVLKVYYNTLNRIIEHLEKDIQKGDYINKDDILADLKTMKEVIDRI